MSQNGYSIGRYSPAGHQDEGPVDAPTDRPTRDPLRTTRAAGELPVMTHGHGAAVVSTQDELLAAALPFLDAGLRAGDLVALACPPETVDLLAAELGERVSAVEIEPRISLLGSRAPDALSTCLQYLERAVAAGATGGSGRLRVLAEVDFGGDPADWREGQRFESVFNQRGRRRAGVLRLPVDRAPPPRSAVVDSAAATHPLLVQRRDLVRRVPASWIRARTSPPSRCPAPPSRTTNRSSSIEDAASLAGLRHKLGAVLATLVRDRDQQEDLHLATAEIAANAFRHGVRPVAARVWADGDRVICVISDRGTSYTRPVQRFHPGPRPRPVPGRHGPLARSQALGSRRRAAHRRAVCRSG